MADPLWSSVAILCHLDNTDDTTTNLGSLGGAPGILGFSTTDQKFGAACASLAATINSDFVNAGINTAGIDMSGDFVIEGWIRSDDIASLPRLNSFSDEGATDYSDHVLSVTAAGAVTLLREVYDLATDDLISSVSDSSATGVFSEGVYHHVVIQRTSGTLVVAIDGVSAISVADTRDYSGAFFINWGTGAAAGFVDEIRLTTASRYTFPFTPPTAAFEDGGAAPTTAEGDGASAGTSTPAAVGATRGALTASSAGVATLNADAVNKTPSADGAAAGTGAAQATILNITQTNGWGFEGFWPPFTVWSFSGDRLTATGVASATFGIAESVRAFASKSAGKWYFETELVSNSSSNNVELGITQDSVALDSTASASPGAIGFLPFRVGYAFDADTREYWRHNDGVWATGDPSEGTPLDLLPTGGGYTPFAALSASSGTFVIRSRFTSSELVTPAPAGFTALFDVPGQGVGVAAGVGAAAAASGTAVAGSGAATGSSTVSGPSIAGVLGAASTAGVATASADGIPATVRDGAAAGIAAVTGLARSTATAQASSAGLSTGTGRMLFEIVGFAAGAAVAAAQAGGRTKFQTGHTAMSRQTELAARSTLTVQTSLIRPSNITAMTEVSPA